MSADLENKVIATAMQLAAETGWRRVTLAGVAERAGMPLADLYEVVRAKGDIVTLLSEAVDREALQGADEFVPENTVRDRLFALVTRRFQALAPHKEGLRAVLREATREPILAARITGLTRHTAALLLETAGVSTSGLSGSVRVIAMAAAHVYAMRTWFDDASTDMADTKVALDQALRRNEALAEFLRCGRPQASGVSRASV